MIEVQATARARNMTLSLSEASAIEQLSDLLYEFLPGSGNNNTAFPIAALRAGVTPYWSGGSKRPAIVQLLTLTLQNKRSSFCPLIIEVVKQSMMWRRGKGNPLTLEEVQQLNELLPGVGFRIPELLDAKFLDGLPTTTQPAAQSEVGQPTEGQFSQLKDALLQLSTLAPHPRGYAFEKFLKDVFEVHGLSPRSAFRLVGEQIDGSFAMSGETYLLEAKWENTQTGAGDLHAFSGKVGGKAAWSRGLFISQSGFSVEGIEAFCRGRPTPIVCLDGLDLFDALERRISIEKVIGRKVRRAAETGFAFIRVRDLF